MQDVPLWSTDTAQTWWAVQPILADTNQYLVPIDLDPGFPDPAFVTTSTILSVPVPIPHPLDSVAAAFRSRATRFRAFLPEHAHHLDNLPQQPVAPAQIPCLNANGFGSRAGKEARRDVNLVVDTRRAGRDFQEVHQTAGARLAEEYLNFPETASTVCDGKADDTLAGEHPGETEGADGHEESGELVSEEEEDAASFVTEEPQTQRTKNQPVLHCSPLNLPLLNCDTSPLIRSSRMAPTMEPETRHCSPSKSPHVPSDAPSATCLTTRAHTAPDVDSQVGHDSHFGSIDLPSDLSSTNARSMRPLDNQQNILDITKRFLEDLRAMAIGPSAEHVSALSDDIKQAIHRFHTRLSSLSSSAALPDTVLMESVQEDEAPRTPGQITLIPEHSDGLPRSNKTQTTSDSEQIAQTHLPRATHLHGQWLPVELAKLHEVIEKAKTRQSPRDNQKAKKKIKEGRHLKARRIEDQTQQGQEGMVDWVWICEELIKMGSSRSRHQILCKAVELGLKGVCFPIRYKASN